MMTIKLLKIKDLKVVWATRKDLGLEASELDKREIALFDLFPENERVSHEKRGNGIVEKVDLSSHKLYTVRFEGGEVHRYSELSASKLKRRPPASEGESAKATPMNVQGAENTVSITDKKVAVPTSAAAEAPTHHNMQPMPVRQMQPGNNTGQFHSMDEVPAHLTAELPVRCMSSIPLGCSIDAEATVAGNGMAVELKVGGIGPDTSESTMKDASWTGSSLTAWI